MTRLPVLPRVLPSALALGLALLPGSALAAQGGEWEQQVNGRPGPAEPDVFHPDREPMPEPRKGGRVIVHVASKPKNINYMVENSATTRRILREVHETLVERDWETWEHRPVLAESWWIEDTVVLKGGRGEGLHDNVLFGKVTEPGEGGAKEDDEEGDGEPKEESDHYLVTPISPDNPLEGPRKVEKEDVEVVHRETVFTFDLHDGVEWHDGHEFDAHDVLFSFEQYLNPHVDCEQQRFKFQQLAGAEVLNGLRIRFFYRQQYFLAADTFENLTILPAHVYDLSDPDNPKHDPEKPATALTQGTFVNEHPNNTMWVGLGPYRVTEFTSQSIDAERFDGYFDPENGGWVDEIRWRHIASDDTTKQAVINGQIDYWDRLRPEDYYGEYTRSKLFTDRFYKGLKAYPYAGYIVWNMRLPKFADPNVRKALSQAFDHEAFIRNVDKGLASPITAVWYYFGDDYDRSLEPVGYDPIAAEDLLLEAGWYDRDGDDIIDKDGQPFTIEFLMPTGNKASELLGQALQEDLAQVGIKMNLVTREWATFLEALYEREFDCANLAWIPEVESDPEQVWHSKWVDGRTSNHAGMDDEVVDELIEEIQVELDDEKRRELFHELQARIYGLQPYLFLSNKPHKIVVSKRIRNFKTYAPDPGYRIREWFIVEEGDAAREAAAE